MAFCLIKIIMQRNQERIKMSIIKELADVIEESRELYRKKEDSVYLTEGENTVHLGDNEIFMKSLINGDMKEKLQMI